MITLISKEKKINQIIPVNKIYDLSNNEIVVSFQIKEFYENSHSEMLFDIMMNDCDFILEEKDYKYEIIELQGFIISPKTSMFIYKTKKISNKNEINPLGLFIDEENCERLKIPYQQYSIILYRDNLSKLVFAGIDMDNDDEEIALFLVNDNFIDKCKNMDDILINLYQNTIGKFVLNVKKKKISYTNKFDYLEKEIKESIEDAKKQLYC